MLFLASQRLSLHRPRSPGSRPLDADVARQRDGHLRRRPCDADRRARPAGRDAGRLLDGRRRGDPLRRPSRHRHGSPRSRWSRRCRRSWCSVRDNPGGVPIEVFDGIRAASLADRSQTLPGPRRRPLLRPQPPRRRRLRRAPATRSGAKACSPVTATRSSASRRSRRPTSVSDLAKFDVPTLVVHGDDDQVVPFDVGGQASADLIADATLLVYPGAPHGITDTHKERLGNDLLEFHQGHEEFDHAPRRVHNIVPRRAADPPRSARGQATATTGAGPHATDDRARPRRVRRRVGLERCDPPSATRRLHGHRDGQPAALGRLDAAYLSSILDTIDGPIVLVGHSYGGFVMTNAASRRPRCRGARLRRRLRTGDRRHRRGTDRR